MAELIIKPKEVTYDLIDLTEDEMRAIKEALDYAVTGIEFGTIAGLSDDFPVGAANSLLRDLPDYD